VSHGRKVTLHTLRFDGGRRLNLDEVTMETGFSR